jgi:hypothetical protein
MNRMYQNYLMYHLSLLDPDVPLVPDDYLMSLMYHLFRLIPDEPELPLEPLVPLEPDVPDDPDLFLMNHLNIST